MRKSLAELQDDCAPRRWGEDRLHIGVPSSWGAWHSQPCFGPTPGPRAPLCKAQCVLRLLSDTLPRSAVSLFSRPSLHEQALS